MTDESKSLRRATRIYEILLGLYPGGHRREYGPLMVQHFRDQFRDAWRHGDRRALTALWIRTLGDLGCSAFHEQTAQITNRMKNTSTYLLSLVLCAVLYGVIGVMWLFDLLSPVPLTLHERIWRAVACIGIAAIAWQWRYTCRFLPVLPGKHARVVAWVLSGVLGTFCTVMLLRLLPEGEGGFRDLHPSAVLWAFVPMGLGGSLLFGLNEAARRKVATAG